MSGGGGSHVTAEAVTRINGVLDECAEAALWSVSGGELEDLVGGAYALIARIVGTLVLPGVREADRRGMAVELGARSTADWLKHVLRVRPGEAKALVELARA